LMKFLLRYDIEGTYSMYCISVIDNIGVK
jgi:hypothetical protein